jgi:tetratricopeptide (TPR) repeat protein
VSDSLPFADHLLSRARLMLRIGRMVDARRLLRRVLVSSGDSTRTRADALRLLARMELDAGRFRQARCRLAAAIRLRRHADDLYVEYARVVLADPDGDPRLAVKALRRAVGIDPHESRSWAALGTAALRAADDRLARKAFRRAARLRPERIDTLEEVVDGFVALGREDEARVVLNTARFTSPNDARVTALWDRFRFALALRQQHGPDRGETILPFPVEVRKRAELETHPVVLRADRCSTVKPHLLRLFGRRSDPRRAQ